MADENDLVQVSFHKVMQTRAYTVVILGTEEKRFAIYADASIGRMMQLYLTNSEKPRPYTHDLVNMLCKGFDLTLKKVVISDVQDTLYFARIFYERDTGGLKEIVELDARPSDCITLALMNEVPVYCTRKVLEQTLPIEE